LCATVDIHVTLTLAEGDASAQEAVNAEDEAREQAVAVFQPMRRSRHADGRWRHEQRRAGRTGHAGSVHEAVRYVPRVSKSGHRRTHDVT